MPKRSNKQDPNQQDPHAAREAGKYANPIPSREFILDHLEKRAQPATHEELCTELLLFDADSVEALRRRLIAMSRDGQIIGNRKGLFGLVKKMDLIKGRVQGHKDGFGFLIPEEGGDDLFLSPHQMRKVFDGDTVLGREAGLDQRGRREGRIVEVLEHKSDQIVGRYYKESGVGIVVPHNPRNAHEILIPPRKQQKATDGDFVVVRVTTFPGQGRKVSGEVVEVLGDVARPGVEIEVALRQHEIPNEWPKPAIKEAQQLKKQHDLAEADRRVDLRDLPFVTIDGEDAKDFDDALYCKKKRMGGWTLYVAIADVSHYVQVGSALDEEARLRGNSVYFPGHVVPMLPEVLSNDLCSLRPEEDRLVMVCQMQINRKGELTDYNFMEGIIYSNARLTYTEVGAILEKPETEREENLRERLRDKYKPLVKDLEHLYSLYKALRSARDKRGAMDIESTETRIIFSDERKIREIIPVERNDAHKLVEECMLCANVATARFLEESKLPALYRVHEGPNPDRLEHLYDFLRAMGIGLARKEQPTPKDYQNILKRLADRPDRQILQVMVIRSMQQAVYQPENVGHFGLGYEGYAHFTSPIRRYPDLLVHRGLRYLIRKPGKNKHVTKTPGVKALAKKDVYPYRQKDLEEMGKMLSTTERRADAATNGVVNWLKCEYMSNRIGDEFEGTVTSVTGFGLFVELKDIYIEGLVHVATLGSDYYHFDNVRHSLTGERSGATFHMGDVVRVLVARVDLENMRIDLQLVAAKTSRGEGETIPKRERSSRSTRDGGKRQSRGGKTGRGGGTTAGSGKSNGNSNSGKKSGGQRSARSGAKSSPGNDQGNAGKEDNGQSPEKSPQDGSGSSRSGRRRRPRKKQ